MLSSLAGNTTWLTRVERVYLTEKPCARHCTISCVQQISYIDHWRSPQTRPTTPSSHSNFQT
jgi:hypothetical protein